MGTWQRRYPEQWLIHNEVGESVMEKRESIYIYRKKKTYTEEYSVRLEELLPGLASTKIGNSRCGLTPSPVSLFFLKKALRTILIAHIDTLGGIYFKLFPPRPA